MFFKSWKSRSTISEFRKVVKTLRKEQPAKENKATRRVKIRYLGKDARYLVSVI